MATAQTLCTRAIRMLGQLASGETPTDDELADALEAMNALIASWQNEKDLCYALRDETLAISTDASYTIGPSGDLVTTRPVEVVKAWIVSSNITYNLTRLNAEEYAAIADKTTTTDIPSHYWYEATMPDGTITFYPVPTASNTLNLLTRTPVSSYVLSDTISLPPGWERAIPANLAVEIAPEYEEGTAPPAVQRAADLSLKTIKRANSKPVKAHTELAALAGYRGHRNILSDT